MPISLLHGCCQIETCAADMDEARGFLIDVLGGVLAEQELARQISALIPGDDYDVDHIDCGQAIFQINRPSPAMSWNGDPSVHQRYLEELGPCIMNLNYFVDDIEHARELLHGMGAGTLIEGPSSSARALADYGPQNTRPGADGRPFLFMGTRDLIGFDLEIMEPNFIRFNEQRAQFPAYVQPRPGGNDNCLKLERLVVQVPDLDAAEANLAAIFSPASRSKPYERRTTDLGRTFRISLGGIELAYFQPAQAGGPVQSRSNVAAIVFSSSNPEKLVAGAKRRDLEVTQCEAGTVASSHWKIGSRHVVGFDTLIEAIS